MQVATNKLQWQCRGEDRIRLNFLYGYHEGKINRHCNKQKNLHLHDSSQTSWGFECSIMTPLEEEHAKVASSEHYVKVL